MMHFSVLFITNQLSLAVLLMAASLMMLLFILEGIGLPGLDKAPVAPYGGELVGAEDDKHQDHCQGKDGW